MLNFSFEQSSDLRLICIIQIQFFPCFSVRDNNFIAIFLIRLWCVIKNGEKNDFLKKFSLNSSTLQYAALCSSMQQQMGFQHWDPVYSLQHKKLSEYPKFRPSPASNTPSIKKYWFFRLFHVASEKRRNRQYSTWSPFFCDQEGLTAENHMWNGYYFSALLSVWNTENIWPFSNIYFSYMANTYAVTRRLQISVRKKTKPPIFGRNWKRHFWG